MTLAEKILELRTAQNLSQGDLAERLEVSRQSVSKWETGQSVPDLDKIIKLADLFGISVDQLVREDAQPQPEQPAVEPQVIYMEKRAGLTPAQITGTVLMVLGGIAVILGLVFSIVLVALGLVLFVLGFPPLLSKKHPWLICGWLLTAVSILVLNPQLIGLAFSSNPISLLFPFPVAAYFLYHGFLGHSLLYLFSGVLLLLRSAVLWLLIILTLRAWFKARKKRD
ncbi:MAG: helix-turn-helix domain-containing protein [Ruminococcaceae bacterium]|nr:helix-turn-helix domain-containing protein [Oscillospiraceae bacterium]